MEEDAKRVKEFALSAEVWFRAKTNLLDCNHKLIVPIALERDELLSARAVSQKLVCRCVFTLAEPLDQNSLLGSLSLIFCLTFQELSLLPVPATHLFLGVVDEEKFATADEIVQILLALDVEASERASLVSSQLDSGQDGFFVSLGLQTNADVILENVKLCWNRDQLNRGCFNELKLGNFVEIQLLLYIAYD